MSHRILVVEDDADIRQALEEIIEEHGFSAVGARHGKEALDLLSRATELPCLIVLDLMMPVMDGPQFLVELKRRGLGNGAKVLLVSGERDLKDRVTELGADGCIQKPVELDHLLATVRRFIGS